jgi:hypothetical protein
MSSAVYKNKNLCLCIFNQKDMVGEYVKNEKFIKLFTRNRPEAMRLLELADNKSRMVNHRYGDFRLAVHYAAQDGDCQSLKVLIGHGAIIWNMCREGYFPLHLAILEERVKIVRILLSQEIPKHVIVTLTITLTEEGHFAEPCVFYSALELFHADILKELVNKFFPLVNEKVITNVVKELIDRLDIDKIKHILEDSKEGMEELSHSDSLLAAIQTECPDDEKTIYILEIGKFGYPLDMAEYHEILDSYMSWCPDCVILINLIRNRRKIINLDTPELLLYAMRGKNLYAMDILFAIGSDPTKIPDDEEFTPDVIKKMLLRGGCKFTNTESTISVVNEFLKQVTLFDLLDYQRYLSDLRYDLQYDGTRKRIRLDYENKK